MRNILPILIITLLTLVGFVIAEEATGPTPAGGQVNAKHGPVQMGAYAQPSALPSPVAAGKVDRLTTDGEGNLWTRIRSSANLTISNLLTADFDSSGSTQTGAMVGLAVPASGGAVALPGNATTGLYVSLQDSSHTLAIRGSAAHDAASSGNPVRIAGRARTFSGTYSDVSVDDTADLTTTLGGLLRTVNDASRQTTGADSFRTVALTNVSQEIKSSTGNFYGGMFSNSNSGPVYVHLYNTANASVTVGTTTPTTTFMVPANQTIVIPWGPVLHSTALCIATTNSTTDDEAATNNLTATVYYK